MTEQIETIDLTPTPEGYANIIKLSANSILSDIKQARVADSRALLGSLIQNVAYLGKLDRGDLIKQIIEFIEA